MSQVKNGAVNRQAANGWTKHVPAVNRPAGPRKLSEDTHDIEVSKAIVLKLITLSF